MRGIKASILALSLLPLAGNAGAYDLQPSCCDGGYEYRHPNAWEIELQRLKDDLASAQKQAADLRQRNSDLEAQLAAMGGSAADKNKLASELAASRQRVTELEGQLAGRDVYAQMIAGKDAATHGEAKNSWLSGTAAWNYVAITQSILGIRPTLDGQEIRPVLPSTWNGFEAVRSYRGVRYEISVQREGTGNQVSLKVDGKSIPGTLIPLPEPNTSTVKVEAVIR